MDHRKLNGLTRRNLLGTAATSVILALLGRHSKASSTNTPVKLALNPYDGIDWDAVEHHKAALHLHTLQSDGGNSVQEVVQAYRRAGFTIVAITDHDHHAPNYHIRRGRVPQERATPYPKCDVPADITWPWSKTPYVNELRKTIPNYPANPTWPWDDYGCPSPRQLGMVGIEANEIGFRHHICSYFNNYGLWYDGVGPEGNYRISGNAVPYKGIVDADGNAIWEDDQLSAIERKGGLSVLSHPGVEDHHRWWMRYSLDWYVERFQKHAFENLIGMEVTNCGPATESYDEGLWDQLLARFMPERPVWGIGCDDMHNLGGAKQTFTVFLLSECTEANVRRAMETGSFYFCKSTQGINYSSDAIRLSPFPKISRIALDNQAGTITISATGCDEVRWISSPESLDPIDDYKTSNSPWLRGQVVHTGAILNYRKTPNIKKYVRAELIRYDGDHIHRTFTNPFGVR